MKLALYLPNFRNKVTVTELGSSRSVDGLDICNMLWVVITDQTPFQDVPVAKTLDDLKRLKEEIIPQVDAM